MMPTLHTIGSVAGKHGFNGDLALHIKDQTAVKWIQKGNFLFVEFDGKGVPFLIETVNSKGSIVKLTDVNTADEASELEGRSIQLAMDVETKEAEWNLNGYAYLNQHGGQIGKILRTEEFPAGLMLIVQTDKTEVLIPLVEEWIISIDEKKKLFQSDFPEGLLDL